MKAGKLRHRLAIDAPVAALNDLGEEVPAWNQVAEVWGAVEPVRGREFLNAGAQVLADVDVRIRLRWSTALSALTAKHRIRHGAQVYNIYSVANAETRDREFEVMAKTGINYG